MQRRRSHGVSFAGNADSRSISPRAETGQVSTTHSTTSSIVDDAEFNHHMKMPSKSGGINFVPAIDPDVQHRPLSRSPTTEYARNMEHTHIIQDAILSHHTSLTDSRRRMPMPPNARLRAAAALTGSNLTGPLAKLKEMASVTKRKPLQEGAAQAADGAKPDTNHSQHERVHDVFDSPSASPQRQGVPTFSSAGHTPRCRALEASSPPLSGHTPRAGRRAGTTSNCSPLRLARSRLTEEDLARSQVSLDTFWMDVMESLDRIDKNAPASPLKATLSVVHKLFTETDSASADGTKHGRVDEASDEQRISNSLQLLRSERHDSPRDWRVSPQIRSQNSEFIRNSLSVMAPKAKQHHRLIGDTLVEDPNSAAFRT